MSDFYVYIYLDTRKSGKFIYGDLEFEYEPIYVGKTFEGRKELIDYVNNYNISQNLTGPNRVSVEGIIYKGGSKNFLLISVNNLKQRD